MKNQEDLNKAGSSEETPVEVQATEVKTIESPVTSVPQPTTPTSQNKLARFLKTKKGKVVAGVTALLLILVVLFAVPFTRYAMLGVFVKKNVELTLSDSKTNQPVSQAEVTLAGQTATTNAEGKATLNNVPVGQHKLQVKKSNYNDLTSQVNVWLLKDPEPTSFKIDANGRLVPVTVVNKITQKPIAKALIAAGSATALTDEKGEATVVVPADQTQIDGTVKLDGYNDQTIKLTVTEQKDKKNNFGITPNGKLHFLSRKSGKIDVVQTNLDGTERKTIVAGTGKEEDGGTVLLASRDWKYLALKARRDSDKAKLYLVETATGKLSVMDEGNAEFYPAGWHGDTFVFSVTRNGINNWQPKKQALKAFNASVKQLTTLDESEATGDKWDYAWEDINSVYLMDGEIVYVKRWIGDDFKIDGKQSKIMAIKPDGSGKRTVKSFDAKLYWAINAKLYEPQELYFQLLKNNSVKDDYFEYENKIIKQVSTINDATFSQFYPTYLYSPSGDKTFWHDPRDGKNSLFVGDKNAKSSKEIASLTDYASYGWFSDEYLLVSKGGSELFIMPAAGGDALKVSDYHKPNVSFPGYGYGYGGL